MTTPSPKPPYYKRPPVVERVATLRVEMTEEDFEAKYDDWREIVQAEFPVDESLKEWLILVEEKEGIPLLNSARPELRITPRFSLKPSTEHFDWSIRCPVGQFTMNMHSRSGHSSERRYQNLSASYEKWLRLWLSHFHVQKLQSLSLHYVNILNRETVPDFYQGNQFLLDRVVSVFTKIPGEHEYLVPPYSSKVNVKLRDREDSILRIELETCGKPGDDPAVKLDLVVESAIAEGPWSADGILELLDWQHDRILDRFEAVFTPEAKKCFQPAES